MGDCALLDIERRLEALKLLVRAGEEGDVVDTEDAMTKARADVLGLAADSADRSMTAVSYLVGGLEPGNRVN